MNKLNTVIRFTFMNKVRTKSFLITTLVLALLLTIGIHIPYFIDKFTGKESGPVTVGLVYSDYPELAGSLEKYHDRLAASGLKFTKYEQADTALDKDLEEGKITGYLQFVKTNEESFPEVNYVSKKDSISSGVQTELQAALQSVKTEFITKGSLSDAQVAELNAPVSINVHKLEDTQGSTNGDSGKDHKDFSPANFAVMYALIILFFMTIMMTGNMISAEVTAEKSSRIMEILITSTSPLAQMFGKIIGMFLIGLLQIFVFTAVIAANLSLPHNRASLKGYELDFSQLNPSVLILGLVYFILGYFLYATLFAAVGSLVSRTEELGQAVMPITMLSLAAFYIGSFSMSAPNSLLMKVCNYIPFFSPISMIVRIGMGTPKTWEIIVSIVVLLIAIYVFGWLSAKIYRTGVLLYGKRPTIKELRKAMKAYKI
ncbi:ABC transporter permease [Paenibacillus motobuensis]|uniref:ABC transporter permease n=1 Tax=Paenibacillus motobuensis TaxID=295324 RepID=A0ABP3HMA8_9BACL